MAETERHRSGEAHQSARRRGLRDGIPLGGFALFRDAHRMSEQVSTDIAQYLPARRAMEKRRADPLFEPGNRLRNRSFREAELGLPHAKTSRSVPLWRRSPMLRDPGRRAMGNFRKDEFPAFLLLIEDARAI
jgi:hypothetical protein